MVERVSTSSTSALLMSGDTSGTIQAYLTRQASQTATPVTTAIPTPPPCPSVGAPEHQTFDNRTCRPEVMIYDAPCTEEVVRCWLFRFGLYQGKQETLRFLLSNKPAASAAGSVKADWCWRVLRIVSEALHATNVPQSFLWNYKILHTTGDIDMDTGQGIPCIPGNPCPQTVPTSFPSVKAFWDSFLASPQIAQEAARKPVSAPLSPTLGGDVQGTSDSFDPFVPYLVGHLATPYAVRGATVRSYSADGQRFRVIADAVATQLGDAARLSHRTSSRTILTHHMTLVPGYGLARARYKIATGSALCIGAPTDEQCNSYEWRDGFVFKADTFVDYCAAWARDIVGQDLAIFAIDGALRWIVHLLPFQRSGQLPIRSEELSTKLGELARERAREGWTASAAAASGPYAAFGVVGAVFTLVSVLLMRVMAEILPIAQGWGCPAVPHKRTVTDATCRISDIQGHDPEAIVDNQLAVLSDRSGIPMSDALRTFTGRNVGSSPENIGLVNVPAETRPMPWLTYALVGSGVLVGALVLRKVLTR